jgi:hypothetical protein
MKTIAVNNCEMESFFHTKKSHTKILISGQAEVCFISLLDSLWDKVICELTKNYNKSHDYYYVEEDGEEYILVGGDRMPHGSDLTRKIKNLSGNELELYLLYQSTREFIEKLQLTK